MLAARLVYTIAARREVVDAVEEPEAPTLLPPLHNPPLLLRVQVRYRPDVRLVQSGGIHRHRHRCLLELRHLRRNTELRLRRWYARGRLHRVVLPVYILLSTLAVDAVVGGTLAFKL